MKKILSSFVLCFIFGTLGLALGGLVSKPFTFTPNTTIFSSQVNSNFDTLYNEFNGNISDANISSSAAIQQSKISNLIADLAARLPLAGGAMTGRIDIKMASPALRLIGTEGSAKDWRIVEDAGYIRFQENTGTEGSPIWTQRYTLPPGTGGPTSPSDLTPKSYVDGLTNGLAVGKVKKTNGDFTTTSSSLVDVTGLTVTLSTGARRARVDLAATIGRTGGNEAVVINLLVDGVAQFGTEGLHYEISQNSLSGSASGSFSFVTDVLSAASHTFKVQIAKPGGGTAVLMANANNAATFSVQELPH